MDKRTKGIAYSLYGSAPIVATVDFGRWYTVDLFAAQTVVAAQAYLDVAAELKVSNTVISSSLNAYAALLSRSDILRTGTPADFGSLAKEAFKHFDALEAAFPVDEPASEPTAESGSDDTPSGDLVPRGSGSTEPPEGGAPSTPVGSGDFPTEKLELPQGVIEKLLAADMPTAQSVRAKDKTGAVLGIDGVGETVRKKILAAVDKAIGPEAPAE